MKVYIEKEDKTVEIDAKTGTELLKLLKINKNTVLIIKDDEIILPEEKLIKTDEIKILTTVSGG